MNIDPQPLTEEGLMEFRGAAYAGEHMHVHNSDLRNLLATIDAKDQRIAGLEQGSAILRRDLANAEQGLDGLYPHVARLERIEAAARVLVEQWTEACGCGWHDNRPCEYCALRDALTVG